MLDELEFAYSTDAAGEENEFLQVKIATSAGDSVNSEAHPMDFNAPEKEQVSITGLQNTVFTSYDLWLSHEGYPNGLRLNPSDGSGSK